MRKWISEHIPEIIVSVVIAGMISVVIWSVYYSPQNVCGRQGGTWVVTDGPLYYEQKCVKDRGPTPTGIERKE